MYIAVDIGGTQVRIAAAASLRKPKIPARAVHAVRTSGCTPQRLAEAIHAVAEATGHVIQGIGMSIAGRVDIDRGEVVNSPNLPHSWIGIPIARRFARRFHCPVRVCNDALASALGEAVYGKTRGNFTLLAWGTGIGGASILRNGSNLIALPFEPGRHHIPSDNGPMEWEKLCGGKGIMKRFGRMPKELSAREWMLVQKEMIIGILNTLVMHPAPTLVVCGGIGLRQWKMLKAIHKQLKRHPSLSTVPPLAAVRLAAFRERAGLYGALACLAAENGITTV